MIPLDSTGFLRNDRIPAKESQGHDKDLHGKVEL